MDENEWLIEKFNHGFPFLIYVLLLILATASWASGKEYGAVLGHGKVVDVPGTLADLGISHSAAFLFHSFFRADA
ncbi:MAG: hypothetical protein ACC628_08200 [Pirellulaceae bacterium]